MISVIVQRDPADKQGPEISEFLITSEQVAIERGRNEIDYNSSNREIVTGSGPLKGFIRPGSLVEVADMERSAWRAKVTGCALTLTRGDADFSADINLTLERIA